VQRQVRGLPVQDRAAGCHRAAVAAISVSCSSASRSPTGSVTQITKSGCRSLEAITQAPLTPADPTAIAHTSATDTRWPTTAACAATRPHSTPARPSAIPLPAQRHDKAADGFPGSRFNVHHKGRLQPGLPGEDQTRRVTADSRHQHYTSAGSIDWPPRSACAPAAPCATSRTS
jgi:hypothetical protein